MKRKLYERPTLRVVRAEQRDCLMAASSTMAVGLQDYNVHGYLEYESGSSGTGKQNYKV